MSIDRDGDRRRPRIDTPHKRFIRACKQAARRRGVSLKSYMLSRRDSLVKRRGRWVQA